PNTEQAALAQVYIGSFGGASRSFKGAREKNPKMEPSIAEAEAHIFAGEDVLARDVVAKLAEAAAPGSERARALGCVGAALGRRAGQPDAAPLLDRLVRGAPNEACEVQAYDFRLTMPRLPEKGGLYTAYADVFLLERASEEKYYRGTRGSHPTYAGVPEVWLV